MKNVTGSQIVLFFNSMRQWPTNAKLEGVYAFARVQGWHIQVLQAPQNPGDVRRAIAAWKPIGCLVDMDGSHRVFTRAALGNTPTVFLDFDDRILGGDAFRINHDPDAVGALAAQHLAIRHFENYAFVGFTKTWKWSDARQRAFRRHLGPHARTFASFALPPDLLNTDKERHAFEKWLQALPKPCGVFCAADRIAEELYPACAKLGIKIPTDVAILGVDDDERLCRNLVPPMSSIRLDFPKAGWLLGELLYEIIQNPGLPTEVRTYEPIGIAPRQSTTCSISQPDRLAAKVLDLIREKALTGASVPKIVAGLPRSRRLLEMRFRETYGKSILEAILEIRLERICELLRTSPLPIDEIPGHCGYDSVCSIKKLFKQRTGLTMREYREKNAVHPNTSTTA